MHLAYDKLFANGFGIRNNLLLAAIRMERRLAKLATCDRLVVHAIGFSRGAAALIDTYKLGAATYTDRDDSAKATIGYVALIDPVYGGSDKSTVEYDDIDQPPMQPEDNGHYRRLQPLNVTTIIKQWESRTLFQPHVPIPKGATFLSYYRGNNRLSWANKPLATQAVTPLADAGKNGAVNSYQIAYINGPHSAWWRAKELSTFALAEAAYAFPDLCAQGIIACASFKLNFHDYVAAPSIQGDGFGWGMQGRGTPRSWTLMPRTIMAPASYANLSYQTTPANYVYGGYYPYHSWNFAADSATASDQAMWIRKPNQFDGGLNVDMRDPSVVQATYGNQRTAFLTYFRADQNDLHCCRQRCLPGGFLTDTVPAFGMDKFYHVMSQGPCGLALGIDYGNVPRQTFNQLQDGYVRDQCLLLDANFTTSVNVSDRNCSGGFTGAW
jgi:hypothetical protein